jgi:N6-adenosine-specific RNA methylase IME4
MDGPQFDALVADIRLHRVREPVVLYEGKILDGRNRKRAADIAGIPCPTQPYEGDDPSAFVFSRNLYRHHLNESQRAMVAAKLVNLRLGDNQYTMRGSANLPTHRAASHLNVSERLVRHGLAVREHGVPDLIRAVEAGEVRVSPADEIARLTEAEQQELLAAFPNPAFMAQFNKRRKQRAAESRARVARIAQQPVVLPAGKFETSVIDLPWPIERGGVPDGDVGWDYPTMTLDEIKAHAREIIRPLIADNGHTFWWTTQKFLPITFDFLKEAEVEYGGFTMVWDKGRGPQPQGLPCYNNEFVVYGRRGSPRFFTFEQHFKTCFQAKPREQGRKPDELYDMIRRVTRGPRIDMFSREKREGFAQHGNEIDRFAEVALGDVRRGRCALIDQYGFGVNQPVPDAALT